MCLKSWCLLIQIFEDSFIEMPVFERIKHKILLNQSMFHLKVRNIDIHYCFSRSFTFEAIKDQLFLG